jgi:hypothetical protein
MYPFRRTSSYHVGVRDSPSLAAKVQVNGAVGSAQNCLRRARAAGRGQQGGEVLTTSGQAVL